MYRNYRQHLIIGMCHIKQSSKDIDEWWLEIKPQTCNLLTTFHLLKLYMTHDIIFHYKPSTSKRITSSLFAALKLWTIITH